MDEDYASLKLQILIHERLLQKVLILETVIVVVDRPSHIYKSTTFRTMTNSLESKRDTVTPVESCSDRTGGI